VLAHATLVVQTGRVITLPVETWATIGTLLSALVALYVAMRAEMRSMEQRLSERIDTLEHKLTERIDRLDDRVYALAAGLKPQVEAARGDVASS